AAGMLCATTSAGRASAWSAITANTSSRRNNQRHKGVDRDEAARSGPRETIKIMSYLRGGVEYVTWDEFTVLNAVKALNDQHRTTNSSQIANTAGLSRTRVSDLVMGLQRRGYLKDVSKGAAYHWRPTGKEARLEGTTPESRDAAVAKAAGELSASAPGLDKVLTEAEDEDD